MPRWKKLPPFDGHIHQGCSHCPPVEEIAPLDMLIAVGFGSAEVTCGNKLIFAERPDDEEFHRLSEFEEMAKANPNHSWIVRLDAPLRSRAYQRQGEGRWVLIESGPGFA